MEHKQTEAARLDVAYVAHLARLHITDEEVALFQPQMEQIVHYVEQINELDVGNVEPTSHAVAVLNVFREDVPRPGLDHEQVMRNAPGVVNGLFAVPRIIE